MRDDFSLVLISDLDNSGPNNIFGEAPALLCCGPACPVS
jgi:hypothetical protein